MWRRGLCPAPGPSTTCPRIVDPKYQPSFLPHLSGIPRDLCSCHQTALARILGAGRAKQTELAGRASSHLPGRRSRDPSLASALLCHHCSPWSILTFHLKDNSLTCSFSMKHLGVNSPRACDKRINGLAPIPVPILTWPRAHLPGPCRSLHSRIVRH